MVDLSFLMPTDMLVADNREFSDLGDPIVGDDEFQNILNEGQNILNNSNYKDVLSVSLKESGIEETVPPPMPTWDADEFLQKMLTDADDLALDVETTSDKDLPTRDLVSPGLDDTSRLLSPGLDDSYHHPGGLLSPDTDSHYPNSPHSTTNSLDLIDYISNDSDDIGDSVSPAAVTNFEPAPGQTCGTTTIILPPIPTDLRQVRPVTVSSGHRLAPRTEKKRRLSASSSDSGVEDSSSGKYPRLTLTDEELRMCAKEGLVFPSHYPLTREEERNLKKVRRKIRNKVSAQYSRQRRKEYMDNMEDRVRASNDEKQELLDKIKTLETQNKTLAAQLRRLHQMVVNGGLRHGQTSTALMVLLLSTALFLIPGLKDQMQPEAKQEIDIQQAVKNAPTFHSRSLLQFTNNHMNDMNDMSNINDFQDIKPLEATPASPGDVTVAIKVEKGEAKPEVVLPHNDHDYTYTIMDVSAKAEPGSAWIEEDAPPKGYGSALKVEEEDRHMNVNVSSSGQGTKTVILQIPKDIK